MSKSKDFWSEQNSSLHRDASEGFYRKKALEHSRFLLKADESRTILDVGCGAGELLYFFSEHANVEKGTDFSASMIEAAKLRLASKPNISLAVEDVFEGLPNAAQGIWTTTGAINQYLTRDELSQLFKMFMENNHVESMYLFDCVDYLRYFARNAHNTYISVSQTYKPSWKMQLATFVKRSLHLSSMFGRSLIGVLPDILPLGNTSMGFGTLPSLWRNLTMDLPVEMEIVSSLYYEYRYHVRISKAHS
jgi:cyclopropane-fatty-acyl-phospholipid synthase